MTLGFSFKEMRRRDRIIGRSSYFIPGSGMGALGNIYDNVDDRWTVENPRQDVFYPRLTAGQNENNQQASHMVAQGYEHAEAQKCELGYNLPLEL